MIDMVELEEVEEAVSIVRTHGVTLLLPEDMVAEVEETEAQEAIIPIITVDNSMVIQHIYHNSNR
jgi:hypothetical protein